MTSRDPRKVLLRGEDVMEEDEETPLLGSSAAPTLEAELLDTIITPSPFSHHNVGPTSARFRNALQRVLDNPTKDAEAWAAILTEASSCYKGIQANQSIHAVDAETQAKLDWIESCFGMLLKYYPYATHETVALADMLLTQSARQGEPGGPTTEIGSASRRAQRCERKLERLLSESLGVGFGDNEDGTSRHLTATGTWVVELWLVYVQKRTRDAARQAHTMPMDQRQAHIRKTAVDAYELAVDHAGHSYHNVTLWRQYLDYCRSWVAPNSNDHVLKQQQQIQLRSVFQRLVTHPMTGLDQLWQEYEAYERSQGEALAQALTTEFQPKYQHARTIYLERNRVYSENELQLGRLAVAPVSDDGDDYESKMQDEYNFITLWKKRCSYERINPERLSPADLSRRIRSAFKEMASVLTRHPESWYMWATWELLGADTASKAENAVTVLQTAQQHIPDSTLLVQLEAQITEVHMERREDSIQVLETFLQRCPNTLGFVLLQRAVRRYRGVDEARGVFARARRTLGIVASSASKGSTAKEEGDKEDEKQDARQDKDEAAPKYVTNRLDQTIGMVTEAPISGENGDSKQLANADKVSVGAVTWHLYASHATIELRCNKQPEVAARVYELGLRKHSSFLTKPAYIKKYAQLLLELNDTVNLKALLARAISACELERKEEAAAALWDLTLHFESAIGGMDASSISSLQRIEKLRREALLGPDVEDVCTGGFIGVGEAALIGAQKVTITDHLSRTEGYEKSSQIVSGMARAVDALDVMGLWGTGESEVAKLRRKGKSEGSDEVSGSASDVNFHKRLQYHLRVSSGFRSDTPGGDLAGSRALSARERLQAGAATTGPPQSSTMTLAIQQMPEWLRPMLMALPASRVRTMYLAKPAPHLTEMALTSLRQSTLPADRPADDLDGSRKRQIGDGGDSSDEEGGGAGGGYGNAFRMRQKARINAAS